MKTYEKGILRIDGLDVKKTMVHITPPGGRSSFGMPLIDFAKLIEVINSEGNVIAV